MAPQAQPGFRRKLGVAGLQKKIRAGLQHQTRQEPESLTSHPWRGEQPSLGSPEVTSGRASRPQGGRGDGTGILLLAQQQLALLPMVAESKAAQTQSEPVVTGHSQPRPAAQPVPFGAIRRVGGVSHTPQTPQHCFWFWGMVWRPRNSGKLQPECTNLPSPLA